MSVSSAMHNGKAGRHIPEKDQRSGEQALYWALCINLIFFIVEVIGGFWTNSLALLSDAGHMFTDVFALGLALVSIRISRKPPTQKHTFGLLRAEVVGAFINGATLFGVCIFISFGAYSRFTSPAEVKGPEMLGIAVLGLLANLASAYILMRSSHSDLNMKGAMLHMISDALGSVAAIVAGGVIITSGWVMIDPLMSILIAGLILWSTLKLLKDTIHVLMAGTPRDVDYERVREALLDLDHIDAVHDLHIWTIASGLHAVSCHVEVPDECIEEGHWPEFLDQAEELLENQFDIKHTTFQMEPVGFHSEKGHI